MIGCMHDNIYLDTQRCRDCGYHLQQLGFATNTYTTKEFKVNGQVQSNGVKKDEGKARFELLDYGVLSAIARILTVGASKYDDRNWEKGISYGRVFGAAQRHLAAYWTANLDGRDGINHADGSESHLDHAITELMFLSAYEKRGMTQFDDRPGK